MERVEGIMTETRTDIRTEVEHITPVKKKLSVEVPATELDRALDAEYADLSRSANIAGFRKGKIPRAVLQKKYGGQVFSESIARVVQKTFPDAVRQAGINAVANPQFEVNEAEEGKPLRYTAVVETRPEIDIKGYRELNVEKRSIEVPDEEMEAGIERLRENYAEFQAVARSAEEGDMAMIDFESFLANGEPIKDGVSKDYPVIVGDALLPGFDEALKGTKAGDEKEVKTTFPEKYHLKALAGKEAVFKVNVKQIKQRVIPPLDNEFAKKFGLKTMQELKERYAAEARASKESEEMERRKADAMDRLIEANPFDVPDSLVERYFETVKKRFESMGKQRPGGATEITPEIEAKCREIAVLHAKRDLIIDWIAEKEKIEVTTEDIEEAAKKIAAPKGEHPDRVMAKIEREGNLGLLKAGLRDDKVFNLLVGN
jgi:trigger factor